MMCRTACAFAVACSLSASLAIAQPPGPAGVPPPGVPQGPPRGMPPRDRTAAQPGTAAIRGRIVAADTSKPLRRARVTLSASELGGEQRTASTGMDGRYEVKDLPAGRYTIRVTR